ncbi:MAG: hypothetical protein NZ483_06540 [Verrucomicrobiae bacterium]|nr:hypothetical protein [Verrucomicrobiae bacterium]MDW8345181.1 hypothetical protein [Verrucomicrobiae bacterium]
MKGLVKAAPIIVSVLCLVSLYFAFTIKGQKTQLNQDLTSAKSNLEQANNQLDRARRNLEETTAKLRQAETDLATAKAEVSAKDVELAQRRREIDQLTRAKTEAEERAAAARAEVQKINDEMAQLKQRLQALDVASIEDLTKKVEALTSENQLLGERLAGLNREKEALEARIQELTTTPADLRGRVTLAKSQWNFLIMDLGREQRVQPNSHFLVYRDSSLVAKARVTSVYPNSSVAELVPGFTKSPPREGDTVVLQKM